MIVHIAFRAGGAWHSRGVATLRDCDGRLEVAREGESPMIFEADRIASVAVLMEGAVVAPYRGADAA